jgi:spore coat polysaccharide biosynthesis protein SpsF
MKSGSVVLIVQARMGSTRLPGKSLMPLAGKPLVYRLLERAKRSKMVERIILAIPTGRADDQLMDIAKSANVDCYRGSENDLLDRYYQAAKAANADIVIRLPADNPVVEPTEIDRIINFHRMGQFDFSTNLSPVLGSNYPDGIGAEAINFKSLEKVWNEQPDALRREHVHLNFINYSSEKPAVRKDCVIGAPRCPSDFSRPDLILDVNTYQQYQYISSLYSALYPVNPHFTIRDIIKWNDSQWVFNREI